MRKKRILLIGGNYYPEPTGIGKYSGEMMDWLAKNGYACSVLTTYPYYPHWKVQSPYTGWWYKSEERKQSGSESITIYRCPHYVPKNPSGGKRILSDFSFFISAFFRLFLLLFTKKYDIVITVVPAFHIGLLGVIYKKIRGAKLIYHIQDLQIEAAEQLQMIRSKRVLHSLYATERFILKRADIVSTISEGMIKKVQKKCKQEVSFFPNWADTKQFYPIDEVSGIKSEYGFKASDKVILYSGAIGEKQGLDAVLYTAKAMQEHEEVKFVICGSGPYKQKLIAQKEELKLNNVYFLPLQPFENLNRFLNMADIHLVLQKADAADLVMPSKLTTILAIGGLAIVTATEGTSLYEVISQNKMGKLVRPENSTALHNTIKDCLVGDVNLLRVNARVYANETLSIEGIFKKFLLGLDDVLNYPSSKQLLIKNKVMKKETVM